MPLGHLRRACLTTGESLSSIEIRMLTVRFLFIPLVLFDNLAHVTGFCSFSLVFFLPYILDLYVIPRFAVLPGHDHKACEFSLIHFRRIARNGLGKTLTPESKF